MIYSEHDTGSDCLFPIRFRDLRGCGVPAHIKYCFNPLFCQNTPFNRDPGMPMVQGEFFHLSCHLNMVIGGRKRPANALYSPPHRLRRRMREIRGFFQVFSFYQRFCFCGYVGVRIGEETIVNTIHTTRPVTRDFTGVFLKKFPEMFLPRKKIYFCR